MTRFTVLVGHRRSGKTVFVDNILIKKVLTCQHPNPIVYFLSPQKQQAKDNSWDYIKNYLRNTGLIESINEQELTIRLVNGGKIRVDGCENPEMLRGKYLDFVVLDEAATFNSDYLWNAILRPMLADRKGGAIITGTAAGHSFLYKMYNYALSKRDHEWTAFNYTPDRTNAIDPEELAKIEASTEPHIFQQEYWNNFDAHIKGTYWGKEISKARMDGRVLFLPHDSTRKVIISWDLGMQDDMVIWYAQQGDGCLDLIDCDILKNNDLQDACKVINSKPYNYAYQIVPHDGLQRLKDNKNKTQKGVIEELTRVTAYIYKKPNDTETLNAHLNSVKYMLEKCRFDRDKCSEGLDSLSLYRAKFNIERGVADQKPLHDNHSDVADSFRALIMGMKNKDFEYTEVERRRYGRIAQTKTVEYNPLADM